MEDVGTARAIEALDKGVLVLPPGWICWSTPSRVLPAAYQLFGEKSLAVVAPWCRARQRSQLGQHLPIALVRQVQDAILAPIS